MSQSLQTNQHATSDATLPLFAPVADELRQVEAMLRSEMRSDYPFVHDLVQYGVLLGGKRLRPGLLLLAAKASGRICREHTLLAAVVEMIHTATLVHDDVLDEAVLRRHLATVNARWDNEASVLLGDFLFSHAFYLASTLGCTQACRIIGRATNIVCEGEIRQKGSRGHFLLKEADYLGIVEAKTAELTACSCELGARYADAADDVTERMTRYGRYLGIAFQIADDLLDVVGDPRDVGKSLGTDLQKQKPTLPLIRVLQRADERERAELLLLLERNGEATRNELAGWFERFDAIAYARQKAEAFAAKARCQLNGLPDGDAHQALLMLTRFVVKRSH